MLSALHQTAKLLNIVEHLAAKERYLPQELVETKQELKGGIILDVYQPGCQKQSKFSAERPYMLQ